MKKSAVVLISMFFVLSFAAIARGQDTSWGAALKSKVQAAGQTVLQKLTPQAQETVNASKQLETPAQQENFIILKAKEYLANGNYQTALDLANYVKTVLSSKSIDVNKIIADAQAALTKMMQSKPAAL